MHILGQILFFLMAVVVLVVAFLFLSRLIKTLARMIRKKRGEELESTHKHHV
jgi:hypothetical protein